MTHDALSGSGIVRRSSRLREWLRVLYMDRWILISWAVALGIAFFIAYSLLSFSRKTDAGLPPGDICLMSLFVAYLGWSYFWGLPGCVWLLYRAWCKMFAAFSVIGFSFAPPLLVISVIALVFYPPLGGGIFHFVRRWWLVGKRALDGELVRVQTLPGYVPAGGLSASLQPHGTQPANPPQPAQGPQTPAPPVPQNYPQPASIQPVFVQPVYVQPGPHWVAPSEPVRSAPGPGGGSQSEKAPEIEQQLRALEELRERRVISQEEHDRQRTAILDKIREPVSLSWNGRKRTLPKQLRPSYRTLRNRGLRNTGMFSGSELDLLEGDSVEKALGRMQPKDPTDDDLH